MTGPREVELLILDAARSSGGLSEAELADIASGYRPSAHEAPVVVGEPLHDRPAFGWVRSLRTVGARLYARLQQVHPRVQEGLKAGFFSRLAATFFKPASPNSPTPGRHYLRDLRLDGKTAVSIDNGPPFGLSFSDPTQESRMADPTSTTDDAKAGPWGERLSSRDIADRAAVWRTRLAECGEDRLSAGELVELVRGDVGAGGRSKLSDKQLQLVASVIQRNADMPASQALEKVTRAAALVQRIQSVSGRIAFADAVVLCAFCPPDGSGVWGQGLSDSKVADRAAAWNARIAASLCAMPASDAVDLVLGSTDSAGRISLSPRQVGQLSVALEGEARSAGRKVSSADMAARIAEAAQAISSEPALAGPTCFADAVAVWATCAPPPRG